MVQRSLSTNLSKNTALFHALLPLDDSFDLITRDLKLGNTPAYWIGVNGFCKTEILQQIFSDLQAPLYTLDSEIRDLPRYVQSKLGYAQVSLTSSIDTILQNILSGPSVLLVEGFAQAVIIDVRTYPVRSISEPDTERITRGAGRFCGDVVVQYQSDPPEGAFSETDILYLFSGCRKPHGCSYRLSGGSGQ